MQGRRWLTLYFTYYNLYALSPVIIVGPAPPATTPPTPGDTAPGNPNVVTRSGGITIMWDHPVESEGVTGYEIWMDRIADTDDTPQWRRLSDPYWYALIYILNGVENGKTYEFKLRAKYGSRTGEVSESVYATPLGSQKYWTPTRALTSDASSPAWGTWIILKPGNELVLVKTGKARTLTGPGRPPAHRRWPPPWHKVQRPPEPGGPELRRGP